MLKPHDLQPAPGSKKQPKRVGRGIGGKGGKTAGRGTKGTKARSKVPVWYEGGQLPLQRRLPKMKGFKNPFRVEYQAVNLDTISETGLEEVTPEALYERGLISKGVTIKILGRGELSRAVHVKAHAVSATAEAAISAAGGTVEILPPNFKGPRPPAQGNQHTNR
jgi:large subunit ribosomal protein L15|tara:strand:- start:489 stop:980 length:492 start_codon:yes stop_codon:yes gene_type:complete